VVYTDKIHLMADSLEELHIFAKSLGLKRCWFQNHKYPHYDLTTKRIVSKVLKYNINVCSTRELVEKFRRIT
jgi:hypothetical protein